MLGLVLDRVVRRNLEIVASLKFKDVWKKVLTLERQVLHDHVYL